MNLNDVAIPLILVNVSRFTEIVGIVFTEIVLKQPIKTKILKSKKFEEWKNEVPWSSWIFVCEHKTKDQKLILRW